MLALNGGVLVCVAEYALRYMSAEAGIDTVLVIIGDISP
jgi:hypothetical protein